MDKLYSVKTSSGIHPVVAENEKEAIEHLTTVLKNHIQLHQFDIEDLKHGNFTIVEVPE